MSGFDIATLTASVAGICMAICQIPQALLVWRTGKTEGLSILMQTILTLGIGMWFVTGLLLDNAPMYISNGFCLIFCIYVLYVAVRNNIDRTSKNIDK